jgi:4-amino-4-deoxy-L-arabinose transferase-like glycosyltransferase
MRQALPVSDPTTNCPAEKRGRRGFSLLDPFPEAARALGPQRVNQLIWAFLILGLVVRTIRYLLQFPLWPDETYLAQNYLDRGYLGLMRPLDFIQIAPILYLWVQKTFVTVLGFSEYSLRLYVFLCSLGTLFLFRHLAGRLLRGTALVLAVGVFAVAYPLIRYSAEAKPYGSDFFVSLVLLCLMIEWWRAPQQRRWWWALGLALPLGLLLSYPAVFIAGGISLTMAVVLGRRGTAADWVRWGLINAAICVGLAGVWAASAAGQMSASGGPQREAFAKAFPPLGSPGKLAAFLVTSNTSSMMSYPVGGDHGASLLTTVCCIVALVHMLRRRRFVLAVLCTVPLGLHFAAAAVHAYPYGNHARFGMYFAPIFCLLTGLGAAGILAAARSWRRVAAPVIGAAAALAVIAVAISVRDFIKPYKETCWMRNRDLARWFWTDKAVNAELVCLHTDFHERCCGPIGDDLASIFYCNQRIYSPRHARGEQPQLDLVSKNHPLRCVRFHPAGNRDADEAAFRDWLTKMQRSFQLVAQEAYPMTFLRRERELLYVDQVEVYEFVPKDETRVTSVLGPGGLLR